VKVLLIREITHYYCYVRVKVSD